MMISWIHFVKSLKNNGKVDNHNPNQLIQHNLSHQLNLNQIDNQLNLYHQNLASTPPTPITTIISIIKSAHHSPQPQFSKPTPKTYHHLNLH